MVNRCRYGDRPIRIESFGHVVQMDQSECRIFTFLSDDGSKTAWAPENEFVVKERCGITSSQSESSILVTWYKWTNQKAVFSHSILMTRLKPSGRLRTSLVAVTGGFVRLRAVQVSMG